MSKLASRDILGKIILFALEFSSRVGRGGIWGLGLDQMKIMNENYHWP